MKLQDTGIGFDRGLDFFSLFRKYTTQYWVFAILNDDSSIAGMASVTRYRGKVKVNGISEERWIGYLGDLRLSSTASHMAHKQWREVYAVIVKHLENPESEEYCDHLITAVFQENLRALQLFRTRLKTVKYHELCPYWNLSIFESWFSGRVNRDFQLCEVSAELLENRERPSLSFSTLPKDPSFRNLLIQNDDTKLGAQLFDARGARTLRVMNIPSLLRWGFRLISLFSSVRYSESMEWIIQGLSALSWDQAASFEQKEQSLLALIKAIFLANKRNFHLLNITFMDQKLCEAIQKRVPISKRTAGWLFEVTSTEKSQSLQKENLVFEGAFL